MYGSGIWGTLALLCNHCHLQNLPSSQLKPSPQGAYRHSPAPGPTICFLALNLMLLGSHVGKSYSICPFVTIISLGILSSRVTCVVAGVRIPLFLRMDTFHCVDRPHLGYPSSIHGHSGCVPSVRKGVPSEGHLKEAEITKETAPGLRSLPEGWLHPGGPRGHLLAPSGHSFRG